LATEASSSGQLIARPFPFGTVAASEGRLVGAYAWSCTWRRQFFDTMSEEERAEFFRAFFEQPASVKGEIFVR
jgi:hypothetical protein